MTPFARLVAVLTGLALVALSLWRAGLDCATGMAAPPAAPVKVMIYDPDPLHLWNRLHHALWGRSAFRVFLRFSEGRKATVAYFAKLSDFPRPLLLIREPNRRKETLALSPDLPQFPVGTQTALVRQMLLIDNEGTE